MTLTDDSSHPIIATQRGTKPGTCCHHVPGFVLFGEKTGWTLKSKLNMNSVGAKHARPWIDTDDILERVTLGLTNTLRRPTCLASPGWSCTRLPSTPVKPAYSTCVMEALREDTGLDLASTENALKTLAANRAIDKEGDRIFLAGAATEWLPDLDRKPTSKHDYARHRLALWYDQLGDCAICECEILPTGQHSHVDHIMPLSKDGGQRSPREPTATCCPSCNLSKGAKIISEHDRNGAAAP